MIEMKATKCIRLLPFVIAITIVFAGCNNATISGAVIEITPYVTMEPLTSNVTVQTRIESSLDYFIASSFSEGLARVERGGQCGFIDKTGELVIPFIYDADRGSFFSEGLALVWTGGRYMNASQRIMNGGKCGFIDRTGAVIIPIVYDKATPFSEGLAIVERNGKQHIINRNGSILVTLDRFYDDFSPFSNGMAGVVIEEQPGWHQRGFINTAGEEVIPVGMFDSVLRPFSEGLAVVGMRVPSGPNAFRMMYGYIDKTGEVVIPFVYELANSFSEGLASVMKRSDDVKWGVINQAGEAVIPFEFDGIGNFSEGLASFILEDIHGYIDQAGNPVITLDYVESTEFIGSTLPPFRNGFAVVRCGEWFSGKAKWGVIDNTGREVIPLNYDFITSFDDGLAITFKGATNFYHNSFNGRWGVLEIVPKESQ
jgi:hypothetical protein